MKTPIIRMEQIDKSFDAITALDKMSFQAYPGEITAIVGDNGSGKSTLINILTGCLKPDHGEIWIKDKQFSSLTVQKAIQEGITTVYQTLALDNCKNAAENIFLGREITRHKFFLDHRKMTDETRKLLDELKIHIPDLTIPVEKMSGGQRQALAIARAVHAGGDIFVFDEPTSAMGLKETDRIMRIFQNIKNQGKTIILISHNLFQVFDISDRICVIKNGRFVDSFLTEESTPEKVYDMIVRKEEEMDYEQEI